MPKNKQTKSPPEPEKKPSWSPLDDIYGDPHHPIDSDFGVDKGKYESPPPKPER